MKHVSGLLLLLLAACGKSASDAENVANTPKPAVENVTDALPAMRQSAPAGTPAAAALQAMNQDLMTTDPQANLRVLNQLVAGFTMSNNRLPVDLEELVKLKLISRVPPAPAGKKFVIDRQFNRVILADQ